MHRYLNPDLFKKVVEGNREAAFARLNNHCNILKYPVLRQRSNMAQNDTRGSICIYAY